MKVVATIFLFVGLAMSQVNVSQQYVDDSNRAFIELKASREALDAHREAEKAKDEALRAKDDLIKALTAQSTLQQAQIADLSKLKCSKVTIWPIFTTIKRCR